MFFCLVWSFNYLAYITMFHFIEHRRTRKQQGLCLTNKIELQQTQLLAIRISSTFTKFSNVTTQNKELATMHVSFIIIKVTGGQNLTLRHECSTLKTGNITEQWQTTNRCKQVGSKVQDSAHTKRDFLRSCYTT